MREFYPLLILGAVLGVLSNAFSDLYRGKLAAASGVSAESMAAHFKSYHKKEWKLKNAARDCGRQTVETLRTCLAILAETDTALKLRSGEEWVLLEQTVARLMEVVK